MIHGVVLFGAFAILWFLALLVVMPIGAGGGSETSSIAGADPGAPASPRLLFKVALATGGAVVLWGIFYLLILLGVLNI